MTGLEEVVLLMVVGDAVSSFFIHLCSLCRPNLKFSLAFTSLLDAYFCSISTATFLFDFFVVFGFVVGEFLLAYEGTDFFEVHVANLTGRAWGGS